VASAFGPNTNWCSFKTIPLFDSRNDCDGRNDVNMRSVTNKKDYVKTQVENQVEYLGLYLKAGCFCWNIDGWNNVTMGVIPDGCDPTEKVPDIYVNNIMKLVSGSKCYTDCDITEEQEFVATWIIFGITRGLIQMFFYVCLLLYKWCRWDGYVRQNDRSNTEGNMQQEPPSCSACTGETSFDRRLLADGKRCNRFLCAVSTIIFYLCSTDKGGNNTSSTNVKTATCEQLMYFLFLCVCVVLIDVSFIFVLVVTGLYFSNPTPLGVWCAAPYIAYAYTSLAPWMLGLWSFYAVTIVIWVGWGTRLHSSSGTK
jgi:hypothetical protein